jgi:catechol 2,3-dioxygenase-like lactoylglutathione lyase family enzyme
MTIQRMGKVGIVVDDRDAVAAFFTELGMELEGRTPIEGSWAGNVVGLDDMRSEIAMMRIPDAPSRLGLDKEINDGRNAEADAQSNRSRGPTWHVRHRG